MNLLSKLWAKYYGLLLLLALFYAGLNLLLVTSVPIVHHFVLTVDVVDANSQQPLAGATVGWAGIPPHLAPWELGVTDESGVVQVKEFIQENPWWVWPPIGAFQFHRRILRVSAPGYEPQELPLAPALPTVYYIRPAARLRVTLAKS